MRDVELLGPDHRRAGGRVAHGRDQGEPSTCQLPPFARGTLTRLIVPTNPATKAEAGRAYSTRGGSNCSSRPSRITATRSAMAIASCWSCVTNTVVTPTCCWSRRISSRRGSRTWASSADSGSSSSSSRGWGASARASATRCFCPPDIWCGYFAACFSSRVIASSRRPLGNSAGPPAAPSGRNRRSAARSGWGNRLYSWKTMPKPRRRGGTAVMSSPSTRILPGVGVLEAGEQPQRGGLAHPEGPSRQTSSPAPMDRSGPRARRSRRTPCGRRSSRWWPCWLSVRSWVTRPRC